MASFNEGLFEEKLLHLKDTQDSIGSLSSWCLSHKQYHEKIVSTWLNVLKKVKIEHRLVLFYLANDVIQYSKRKSLPFVESFASALQKATKLVREDNVRNKIMRLFKIWSERGIYEEEFLVDLSNVLNRIQKNTSSVDVQEFQSSVMYSKIRKCKELEEDTDIKLNALNKNHISFTDIERFKNTLKDREHGNELLFEFDGGISTVKAYINALETEINERLGLINVLEIAEEYYEREFQEAKVVVNAYKCFATRIRGVKRKLEDQIETMPSPVPSPDENSLSPPDFLGSDKQNSYFPPKDLREENEENSPYSPDSDLDLEPLRSTFLDGPEESGLYELKNSFISNGVESDSSKSKTLISHGLTESLSNDKFCQQISPSIAAGVNNISTSNEIQGNNDISTSDVQQLSLSALLQTLIPSEKSIKSSIPNKLLVTSTKPEKSTDKTEDSWESPESPPLYEKVNYPTIADEQIINQDTIMRFADVDDRSFIELNENPNQSWPNDDIDYRTSGNKTAVSCSQNQDNVENIDMEMSDEEEKLNKIKHNDKDSSLTKNKPEDILATTLQNSNQNSFKVSDISKEVSFINVNAVDNTTNPIILPKTDPSLSDNNSVTPSYNTSSPYINSSYSSNDSVAYGINASFSNNTSSSFQNYPDFVVAASGKGDAPNVSGFNVEKFPKLQAPLPPLLPPPPPPPPPPHPQLWSPAFSSPPPPPQYPTSQNFAQPSIFFPRPPPPVLPNPQLPVMNRQYRANFRPFQRVSPRFQRW